MDNNIDISNKVESIKKSNSFTRIEVIIRLATVLLSLLLVQIIIRVVF